MKPEIFALFTDSVQAQAAKLFDINPAGLKLLSGFDNYVCEGIRDGQPHILRITHSSHRNVNQVQAELDWVDYLANHDVSVCRPLRSLNGNLVEKCNSNQVEFVTACFEKAPGKFVGRNETTVEMVRNRGRLLGRMHALSKSYKPGVGQPVREQWFESDDFTNYRSYLRPDDSKVAGRIDDLLGELRAQKTDANSYGLIHQDAHEGNLQFEGDNPTIFDFDDCAYDFLVSDIAVALFYAVLFLPVETSATDYGRDFLHNLLAGYREENSFDNRWLELVPLILKRREIFLYVALHRATDMDNLNDWWIKYLTGRREKIENEVPFLDIDLSEFAV